MTCGVEKNGRKRRKNEEACSARVEENKSRNVDMKMMNVAFYFNGEEECGGSICGECWRRWRRKFMVVNGYFEL